MFDISPIQIIIVLVIALLVFGPKRLPELGRSVGRGLREFKGALNGEPAARAVTDRSPAPPPASATTPASAATGTATGTATATVSAATATAPSPGAVPADRAPEVETDTLEGIVVPGDTPPPPPAGDA